MFPCFLGLLFLITCKFNRICLCFLFIQKTWEVIYRLMKNELDKFMVDTPLQLVRQLYEQGVNPEFSEPMINEKLVCVNVRFTCNGEICSVNGIGVNKKNAKRAAAKLALSKLRRT